METFELELLGGTTERRYRRMRPEIEAMPWDTFHAEAYPEPVRLAARIAWTSAAFQEHRTGAACAIALQAMIEARTPVDLIAVATRFPLDEMVHVELCARMAALAGGATEILYDPHATFVEPGRDQSPLRRAAEAVVRTFCVGEAVSIPLLRGTARAATHPLPRAVLSRIVRDEAAHGVFGYTYLDWAGPLLDAADRDHLAREAARTIVAIESAWDEIRAKPPARDSTEHALGWMKSDAYRALAQRSMRRQVIEPLLARGIDVAPHVASSRADHGGAAE